MKTTSIIIPHYNEKDLLLHCLHSIKQHTKEPHEIIVVDNGSHDGSLEACIEHEVTVISLPKNVGFPVACNYGLQIASGEELLLLNNDVLVTPNWLSNMQKCLYSDDHIGIVGPMTNYASGRQQITMPFTSIDDMVKRMNKHEPNKWMKAERIVGLCFLFKRELLERLGLLDELFSPGHFEDDDYCYRARQAGYKLMIVGDVFVYHEGSYSFNKQGDQELQLLIERNKQKFIDKWGVDPQRFN